MDSYKYRGAPEARAFGPLPEGDYNFIVTGAQAPYYKNDKWILALKLAVQPQGVVVFCNPWSGIDKNGDSRDGIGELLLAVNRTPAVGEEPDWGKLIGAKGKCRLKVEIAQAGALEGKEVNKVAFFHRPKQVGPTSEPNYSPAEVKAAAKAAQADLAGNQTEPDDIPF